MEFVVWLALDLIGIDKYELEEKIDQTINNIHVIFTSFVRNREKGTLFDILNHVRTTYFWRRMDSNARF